MSRRRVRERSVAIAFSAGRKHRRNLTRRIVASIFRARINSHGALDVCDPGRLHRRARKRNHRRDRGRFRDRSGSNVRGTDLLCVDESSALARTSARQSSSASFVDLSRSRQLLARWSAWSAADVSAKRVVAPRQRRLRRTGALLSYWYEGHRSNGGKRAGKSSGSVTVRPRRANLRAATTAAPTPAAMRSVNPRKTRLLHRKQPILVSVAEIRSPSLRSNPAKLSLISGQVRASIVFWPRAPYGETGRVIGVDMTHEMLAQAKDNARKNGYANVEFRLGEIEALP